MKNFPLDETISDRLFSKKLNESQFCIFLSFFYFEDFFSSFEPIFVRHRIYQKSSSKTGLRLLFNFENPIPGPKKVRLTSEFPIQALFLSTCVSLCNTATIGQPTICHVLMGQLQGLDLQTLFEKAAILSTKQPAQGIGQVRQRDLKGPVCGIKSQALVRYIPAGLNQFHWSWGGPFN